MEEINIKHHLEIEVLTPLSIGAGAEKDWVRGIDFVIDQGKLYKLNLKKMVAAGIKPEELSSYFATKNENGLKQKLAGKLEKVCDFIISYPVPDDETSTNDIKSFVKNQLSEKPVLTGSSLKGALRSIILDSIAEKPEIESAIEKSKKERRPFESFIFGSSTEGDEFMRFIKLSDAEFEGTSLVNTKIFNLRSGGSNWQGGWKHGNSFTNGTFKQIGFNTIYECLMPKQKSTATLMLSAKNYDKFEEEIKRHIKGNEKYPILHNDISFLFGIINKHTKEYLQKERAFFSKYSTDKTDKIVASIDALICQIPVDNSYCILKMSAGSGFHSITGDWQFPDNFTNGKLDRKRANKEDLKVAGKVLPKSRKIADWDNHLSLMGFVKLRAMSYKEVKQLEENHKAEMLRNEQERKEKEKVLRIAAEKEAQAQREKEERQRQFNAAIAEIKQLINAEQYELALGKFEGISKSYPNENQYVIDVDDLRNKVEVIILERKLQEESKRQEQERLKAQQEKAEGGLAKLLDEKYEQGPNAGNYKVTSFKVCAQKVTSWMKSAIVSSVPQEQYDALHNTLYRLALNPDKKELKAWGDEKGNIWKTVSGWVGPDLASLWYHEITNK